MTKNLTCLHVFKYLFNFVDFYILELDDRKKNLQCEHDRRLYWLKMFAKKLVFACVNISHCYHK